MNQKMLMQIIQVVVLLPVTLTFGLVLFYILFMLLPLGIWSGRYSVVTSFQFIHETWVLMFLFASSLLGLVATWYITLRGCDKIKNSILRLIIKICLSLGISAALYLFISIILYKQTTIAATYLTLIVLPPIAIGARQLYLLSSGSK